MADRPPYLVDADSSPVVALRLHTPDDVGRVLEQCLDPLTVAHTGVPVPYSLDDARRFCLQVVPGGWEDGTEWALAVDVDGRFGGTVSLRPAPSSGRAGRAELAYGAHPDVRGTGVLERALRLLLEWGFAEQGLETVVWSANRGNWASRRLAWRLGVRVEGTMRGYLRQRDTTYDAWVGTLLASDERRPVTPWLDVPRIESPRLPLRLRPLRNDDVPRIVEAAADQESVRWLADLREASTGEAAVREDLLRSAEHAAEGTGMTWCAASAEDDRLVGRVSLLAVQHERERCELGYWVHPEERGAGLATEIVRLALRHCFVASSDGGLGLTRVTAHAAVENRASRRVLEKAEMTAVGTEHRGIRTRDGLADAVLYELTR